MPTTPHRRTTSSAVTTCRMVIRGGGSSTAVSDSSSADKNDWRNSNGRLTRGGLLTPSRAPSLLSLRHQNPDGQVPYLVGLHRYKSMKVGAWRVVWYTPRSR